MIETVHALIELDVVGQWMLISHCITTVLESQNHRILLIRKDL